MDTEKWKAILCAIDMGSLSAAADRLGYTPSGISRMLHSLEKEAGFPLLIRQHSGVTPTRECEGLIPIVRELVDQGEKLGQKAAELRGCETGTVVAGIVYPSYYHWLGSLISIFKGQYPAIQIQIMEGTSSELYRALGEHRLDFGIVSRREGDFQWTPLETDPLVAWVPEKSLYAARGRFPIEAFSREPYIATSPEQETDNNRVFERLRITPNTRYTTSDSYAAYSMVEAGLGVSMNNAIASRNWNGHVVLLPVDPPQEVEIGIAAPSREEISPAAKRFLEFARARITTGGTAAGRAGFPLKNKRFHV